MILHGVLGIMAGILLIPAFAIYVFSIFKGETRPNRATWWILALISTIAVFSYHGLGARDTIWLPIAYAAGYACIALLSLAYGDGPFSLSFLDRISLAGGLAGAIMYWLIDSPLLALLMVTLTELVALLPTATKSYSNPESENRYAWLLGTLASLLNIFAIGEWSFGIAAYPLWVFASNAVITYFLLRKKRVVPLS
jgi:hypothetical protein